MAFILQTVNSTVQKEIAFNSYCHEMAKNNISLACSYIKSTVTGAFIHPVSSSITSLALKDRCMNLIKTSLLLLRAPLLYLPLTNRVTQLALRFLSPQQVVDFVKSSSCYSCSSQEELRIRYDNNALTAFEAKQLLEENIRENKEFDPSTFTNKNLLNAYIKLFPLLSIDLISSSELKKGEVKARYSEDTRHKVIEDYFLNKISGKEKITKLDLDLSKDEKTIFTKLGLADKDCYNFLLNLLGRLPKPKRYSVPLKKEIRKHMKSLPD